MQSSRHLKIAEKNLVSTKVQTTYSLIHKKIAKIKIKKIDFDEKMEFARYM
jgi:hypothetical protein